MLCKKHDNECKPEISVVIPTLNEREAIPQLIEALRSQDTEYNFEIVVADNGSIDGTYGWLQSQPDIRAVQSEKKQSIAHMRNKGVTHSRADHIIQTDADAIPPNGWLQRYGDTLLKDGVDLAGSGFEYDLDDALMKDIVRLVSPADLKLKYEYKRTHNYKGDIRYFFPGENMAYTKELFRNIGGGNEKLKWGEDVDFSIRAHQFGANIKYIPENEVITSHRRLGDTPQRALEGVFRYALRNGLRDYGFDTIVEYERIDIPKKEMKNK